MKTDKNSVEIELNGLTIRSLEESDIEKLRVLRNDNRRFFLDDSPITPEMQLAWYENYKKRATDYMFVVEQDETIGFFALYDFDEATKSYEFGRFLIEETASGKGSGTTALLTAMALCFSFLGAASARLEVLRDNERAAHVYEKIGFKETDTDPSGSIIHMGLSADEYLERYRDVYSSVEAQIQD